MRTIELREVEGIHVVLVDGEAIGLDYTKETMNAMLDDLETDYPGRSRDDILSELVARTASKRRLADGPLSELELIYLVKLVRKSIKRGWFS